MSEFLGEAFVRIRPDTSTFATELKVDVVAAAAAASASATSSAKSAKSQAAEAGIKVRNLATATTALTQAQNANKRVAESAARALGSIASGTDKVTVAQERTKRAAQTVTVANKAVEKSKIAAISTEKALAGAIAAGNVEVLASVEKSAKAAQAAVHLAESNQVAAISHEKKAAAALSDARAEEAAAAATAAGIKGNVGAAAAAAAAASRGVAPPVAGAIGGASTAEAGAAAGKAAARTQELVRAQNLQTLAASKLSFANREVAVTTTALAAAQETARRSTAAVAVAENALAAAQGLKNVGMIESATNVLNDARAKQADAIATVELAEAELLHLSAVGKLDNVTRKIAGVTSELAAAQIRATRATSALVASEEALAAALATTNPGLITAATETNRLAIAQEREAIAALKAAKAQQVHSSQLAFARRGALASALTFVGLRGATLAANSAFIAGAAALLIFAKSLGLAAKFETQLNVFRVTTGATADEMSRVSDLATQLGADLTLPGVSAGDAAEAMTELAKAGLSVEDAMSGARGVLQLATAANISNADATALAASALNAFGLAGDQAVRVADVLANAANAAQGSIQDMGLSLQQAAAVGRQVGLSLEDTTVFLTSLTRAGIRGSDAGTSLRTALLRLINPTKKIKAVFDELHLSLRDTEGNLRPDFFVNLGLALEGLSKKQRDAKLAILGGADAIRSLSILSRQSIEDIVGLRQQIREQGTAAEVASARTSGLAGAGKALSNTLENIGLSIGQSVTPGLTSFVLGLSAATASIAASEGVRNTLSQSLNLIGDSFQALGAIMQTIGPIALPLVGTLNQVVNSIGVTSIVGAVVAFKLLAPTLAAVKAAYASLYIQVLLVDGAIKKQMATAGAAGALGALRAGLSLTAARFAAFATSATGVGIAVAAAAAGFIYLATRESSLERAHRHLTEANDDLVASLGDLAAAGDAARGSASNLRSEQIALRTALLSAQQARGNLDAIDAPRGSFERKQAENQLAIALDSVRAAELRLAETRRQHQVDLDALAQEEINRGVVLAKQVQVIQEVIAAEEIRGRFVAKGTLSPAIGTLTFQQRLIDKFRELAAANRAENTEFSRNIAGRQELIARFISNLDEIPDTKELQIILNTKETEEALRRLAASLGITGKEAVDAFINSFGAGLPGIIPVFKSGLSDIEESHFLHASGFRLGSTLGDGVVAGVKNKTKAIAAALREAITAGQTEAERAATRIDVIAGAGGGKSPQLAAAQEELAARQREFDAARQLLARGDSPARRKAFEDAAAARRQAFEQVKSLQEGIASDAEQAKRDAESKQKEIETARDKADQAVIDAFTSKRGRLENLLIRAGGTEGSGDDIKFNKVLVNMLKNQKKLAGERIKNLEKRRDFVRDTNKLILTITNQIKDDEKKQKDLLRQKREDRQAEIGARIEADIEFAQIRENVGAEIRARQARIRFLQAQQRQILKEKGQRAKNTAAYKELRNQIASEIKAIKDLRKEKEGLDDEARKMIFEFLQTQQGFAANLLGNLFPSDMFNPLSKSGPSGAAKIEGPGVPLTRPADLSKDLLKGLPGRGPGSQLRPEAAVAEARDRGPTASQSNVQIDLLRKILSVLQGSAKGNAHPEANYQRAASRAGGSIFGVSES